MGPAPVPVPAGPPPPGRRLPRLPRLPILPKGVMAVEETGPRRGAGLIPPAAPAAPAAAAPPAPPRLRAPSDIMVPSATPRPLGWSSRRGVGFVRASFAVRGAWVYPPVAWDVDVDVDVELDGRPAALIPFGWVLLVGLVVGLVVVDPCCWCVLVPPLEVGGKCWWCRYVGAGCGWCGWCEAGP